MIETEPRLLDEDLFAEVGSDGGGNGWTGDDAGDGWGWSEDPEDDGPPYRRSRVIRAVAVATAAAVVLGSIGTWVVFLAVGSPQASFAVNSVEAALSASNAGRSGQFVDVRFEVANQSNTGAPATCRATVATATSSVGSAEVRLPRLAGGQWERRTVAVPVDPSALAGNGPASARVTCRPAASG